MFRCPIRPISQVMALVGFASDGFGLSFSYFWVIGTHQTNYVSSCHFNQKGNEIGIARQIQKAAI